MHDRKYPTFAAGTIQQTITDFKLINKNNYDNQK